MKTPQEWSDNAVEFKLGFVSAEMLMPLIAAVQRDAIQSASKPLVKALEDLAEQDCCRNWYPQQYEDGRCHHCIAEVALKTFRAEHGEEQA